ncbi:MAG: M23 family metallopeptidase [Lachnospiraceae bacterium]|nr:M23 family metallopeptidase [Lachnospiraceae bacterium]
MRKLNGLFSSKGFYIAICAGIFAVAGIMIAMDIKNTKEGVKKENAVDLNQPVEDIADNSVAENIKEDVTTEESTDTQLANASGAIPESQVVGDSDAEASQTSEESTVSEEVVETDTTESEELVFDEEHSLVWPLVGNVVLPYSMDTTIYFQTLDVYKCNPAILIEGEEGEDVVSACKGVVKEVTETKEYGTIVIVDMGSGYEATYGQLMNVCVVAGDTVSESQNIGELAIPSSYYTEEGVHLYFAITKDGVPVDPMTLIQ